MSNLTDYNGSKYLQVKIMNRYTNAELKWIFQCYHWVFKSRHTKGVASASLKFYNW